MTMLGAPLVIRERDWRDQTYNRCRDARECLVGGRPLSNQPTSNGCRDARSVRPLYQRLRRPLVLTGTDARIVRPYISLLVSAVIRSFSLFDYTLSSKMIIFAISKGSLVDLSRLYN